MSKTKNPNVKKNFTKVPNGVIESPNLRPTEKLLVVYILSFDKCFASLGYMAKRLGYSRSTVQRAMAQLQLKGIVDKVRGGGFSYFYVVQNVETLDTQSTKNE